MIELIYFGMMPIIVVVCMVIHKLGWVNMFNEIDDNPFAGLVTLIFWPLVIAVLIIFGIFYTIFAFLNAIADCIVKLIKRYTKDDDND